MFFRGMLTDLPVLQTAQNEIKRIQILNETVQSVFRTRAAEKRVDRGNGRFIDPTRIPVLAELNAALLIPTGPLEQELKSNCARLERLAPMLMELLAERSTTGIVVTELLGDLEQRLN
jgi:hypothetical protein